MSSNNIIKGRIAETIVSEMLDEAGYFVYRFGYEGILQSLIQKGLPRMREDNITAEKIKAMPDFIVMDRNTHDVFFIEVKYRKEGNGGRFPDWLKAVAKYWPEAKVILVHPQAPHFMISTIKDYAKTGRLYRLEQDKFLHVDTELTLRYSELVKKYFG